MLRLEDFLKYAVAIAILWITCWYIVYFITGFHLQTVSAYNGILLGNVSFNTSKVQILIGRIRLHLWGSSRRLIIEDFQLIVKRVSGGKKKAKSTKKPKNGTEAENNTLNVLPRNWLVRFLAKFVLRRLSYLDIEIRNFLVNDHQNKGELNFDYIRFHSKSRPSERYNDTIKFFGQIILNKVTSSPTGGDETEKNAYLEGPPYPVSADTIKLEVNAQINLSSGLLYKIKTKVFTDHFKIRVFGLLKKLDKYLDRAEAGKENTKQNVSEDTQRNDAELIKKLQRIHRRLYPSIDEVAFHVENTSFDDIPLIDSTKDDTIKDYMKNHSKPNLTLELKIKSISINYLRLNHESPGFQVLFHPVKDTPFHITFAVQLLTINYTNLLVLEDLNREVRNTDEIMNIPLFGFTFKSNFLDHLARGDGFENCVMELFSSTSSPILDLETDQLTSIIYNIVMFYKYALLSRRRKNKSSSTSNSESNIDKQSDLTYKAQPVSDKEQSKHKQFSIKKRLLKLLHDTYPKLEFKMTLEQPRFIIRHNKSDESVKLLNFLYSFLNIHIITTSDREYDVNCNFLHPAIEYVEKTIIKESKKVDIQSEIFGIKSLDLRLDVFKNFKIKPNLKLEELTINLGNLDVLCGISNLLQEVAVMIDCDISKGLLNLRLNQLLLSESSKIQKSANSKEKNSNQLFARLPYWLLEVSISVSNILVSIGSRSLFILPGELRNTTSNTDDFIGSNNELRKTQFSLESFTILLTNQVVTQDYNVKSKGPQAVALARRSLSMAFINTNHTTASGISLWGVLIKTLNLNMSVFHSKDETSSFLSIPSIDFTFFAKSMPEGRDYMIFQNSIGNIQANSNRYDFFVILGSVYLVREFIIQPIKQIKERLSRDESKLSNKEAVESKPKLNAEKLALLEAIKIDSLISNLELKMLLSDDFDMKLQFFNLNLNLVNGLFGIKSKLVRVLVDSPTLDGMWARVLVVDSIAATFNPKHLNSKSPEKILVDIECDAVRAIQCHQFVVYNLFDNLSINIKTLKHLIKSINDNVNEDSKIVEPNESKTLKVPSIRLKTKKICFSMEDDPFESELTMIYQLGLVEQRKRLEEYYLFENQAEVKDISTYDYYTKLNVLQEEVSRSWIRKVKVYKAKLNEEILQNKKYIFGSEALIPGELNEGIVAYLSQAPLFSIIIENANLKVQSPKFDFNDLSDFIYKIGQQVPKDTIYSLMLPSYVDLEVGELRIHLRDYPLPLLHVPGNRDNSPSLTMAGHLIISENLVTAKENIRELIIPLIHGLSSLDDDNAKTLGLHKMIIQRSLSTVKLYSDIQFEFQTEYSTRFVWGQSFQFALQQTIRNFDQFSKPPVDPLEKLGTWDKLRLIIHGNFKIRVADKGDLQIAIKGSRDPYNLFGTSSGFVLGFKDSVEWKINEHDDPKLFFEIIADKVFFFVPNYLAAPLLAWTRHSSKSTYLPAAANFISSTFAYYLENIPMGNDQTKKHIMEPSKLKREVLEKVVLKLNGGVNFKVGFLLQRDDINNKGSKTYNSIPHYEVELFNPKYTKKGHDSFKGFRSDYIHMAISLTSNNDECKNSIHLSPGVFKQLFAWWVLFAGNMMLPVRTGPLFGETMESKKFSQHLTTNKFLFKFKSVFISHIYRDETVDVEDEKIECIGVRAKMEDFVLDLHQRKETKYLVHEGLKGKKKTKKMNFNIGQSHLKGIDLRTVYGVFKQDIYEQQLQGVRSDKKSKETPSRFISYDNDTSWFDIDDYEEVFIPSLGQSKRVIKVYPMSYIECFSYIRDTSKKEGLGRKDLEGSLDVDYDQEHEDDDSLGLENSHECLLNSQDMFASLIDLYKERIGVLKIELKKKANEGHSTKDLMRRIHSLKENIRECEKRESRPDTKLEKTDSSVPNDHISENNIKHVEPSVSPRIKNEDRYEDNSRWDCAEEEYNEDELNSFHNRFLLISMLLKWNVDNRNLLLKYIQSVQWKSAISNYLSYEAISTLEDIIEKRADNFNANDLATIRTELSGAKKDLIKRGKEFQKSDKVPKDNSESRLKKFDTILQNIDGAGKTITEDYLIEVISPQIQLQSHETPDSVLLITAPKIEAKIVSVVELSNLMVENFNVLEERFGVLMKDANVFILDREEIKSDNSILNKLAYGSTENWPPWLGIEICKNGYLAGKGNFIVEKVSSMVIYERIKPLGKGDDDSGGRKEEDTLDDKDDSAASKKSNSELTDSDGEGSSVNTKLLIDVPKLCVTSTAKQYATLYSIVTTLLLYTEPTNDHLSRKLEKLRFSIDFQDLNAINSRLINLHKYYRLVAMLCNNYQFRQHLLDNENLNDYLTLNSEKDQIAIEIYLMLQSILSGDVQTSSDSSANAVSNWIVGADQIIFHLLQDDRTPILDVAMARGRCKRIINEDGSNSNKIEIYMMQIFNLLKTAKYPQLFGPLKQADTKGDIVTVDWKMNREVGGIKFIEKFVVKTKPLEIKIDDITGEVLMKYIFQTEEINDSPLLNGGKKNNKLEEVSENEIDAESESDISSFDESSLDFFSHHNSSKESLTRNGGVDITNGYNYSGKIGKGASKTTSSSGSGSGSGSASGSGSGSGSGLGFKSKTLEDPSSSDWGISTGEKYENDVDEMVARAKNFMSIGNFNINSTSVLISIKCSSGYMRILNVENFVITLPVFQIQSQVVSALDITLMIKKTVIKALLSHSGRLLKNKLSARRRRGREIIRKPLRPVRRYVEFTKAAELRGSVS